MLKKVICHFAVVLVVILTFSFIGDRIEKLNPLIQAVRDINITDIHFLFDVDDIKPSSNIYIVDIGDNSPLKNREEIANFIEKVNSRYKPKVIGVDVYFDSKYKDEPINERLITSLSMDNVIKMFKLEQLKAKEGSKLYPDFSVLPGLENDIISKDGYTFGLGAVSEHACIRYYKPNYEIEGKTYNHFSKLIAQKYQASKKLSSEENIEPKMMINYNINFTKNRIGINDSTRYHELEDQIVLIGLNTYQNDGKTPLYNEDLHFTPKNPNYIGRSAKDSYGIEILATIISNRIYDDHFSYNETFINWINWIITIAVYIFLLFVFTSFNKYFVFFKIFIQTIGILLLAIISLIIMSYSNYYINFTPAIGVIFISAQFIKFVETLLRKFPNYINKNE